MEWFEKHNGMGLSDADKDVLLISKPVGRRALEKGKGKRGASKSVLLRSFSGLRNL